MADTASRNGRKNTTQSRKTGTQGRKTSTQGRTSMQKSSQRKKTGKKNAQTQTNQLKNDSAWDSRSVQQPLSTSRVSNGLCSGCLVLWNMFFQYFLREV